MTHPHLPAGTIVSPRSLTPLKRSNSQVETNQHITDQEKYRISPFSNNHNTQLTPTDETIDKAEEDTSKLPYILGDPIAEGGYGVVYKAELCTWNQKRSKTGHVSMDDLKPIGKFVAAKLIVSKPGDKVSVGPLPELDVMSRFDHPNLMKANSVTQVEFTVPKMTTRGYHPTRCLSISMPLAECDVSKYMLGNLLSFQQNLTIMWQLMQAVKFLHDNYILHCDIKLENTLIMSKDPLILKLSDFGLCKYTDHRGQYRSEDQLITLTYRPLEGFGDKPIYGRKCDVWSIGMYFLNLLLRKKFIHPNVSSDKAAKEFIIATFSDHMRKRSLANYLKTTSLNDSQNELTISFLDRALCLMASRRADLSELILHPIFDQVRQPVVGICHNPVMIPLPNEKIMPNVYLAMDYLIQLCVARDPKAETAFLAFDLFQRSLIYIHCLQDHFRHYPLLSWIDNCSMLELLTLGAVTVFWISIKTVEDIYTNIKTIIALAGGKYSPGHILEMERQLLVGLDGAIYRNTPFNNSVNWDHLVGEFDAMTNIFLYRYRLPIVRLNFQPSVQDPTHDVYLARFKHIYQFSQYYQLRNHISVAQIGHIGADQTGTVQRMMASNRFHIDRQSYVQCMTPALN